MKHKGIILAYELGKRLVKDASAGKCQMKTQEQGV
jgi:hypothetical protein